MILLIAIILFIIFVIYSTKPRGEGYTLEGIKLSWKNKASIEGVVYKWIVTLKDKSGTKIHEYENSDAGNLKDYTDVTMNIVENKEFDNKIIGDNTLELYYNKVSSDTKLYTKTVTFTENDFSSAIDMSKLEEVDIDCVGKYVKVKKDNTIKGDERFACGPADDNDRHYCQFWKYEIQTKKYGSGKACTREDNYVIKVQWPTETTASFKKLDFHTDPDPNTDQNVSSVPQYYKNEWDKTPVPEPEPGYTYDFILNVDVSWLYVKDITRLYIEYIELDGVLIKKEQIITHIIPNGGAEKMTSKTSGPATWDGNKYKVGDKIFTIQSDKKIDKIDITYTERMYTPGWIIKENDVIKIKENQNRYYYTKYGLTTFTYDIKNGKSTIFGAPYKILLSGYKDSKYKDDWCKQGPAVHQDVPGCGRICSTNTHAWRKNKSGKKKWSEYPGSVDCPAAKLDEVWQKKPGTDDERFLRTGSYSSFCNLM